MDVVRLCRLHLLLETNGVCMHSCLRPIITQSFLPLVPSSAPSRSWCWKRWWWWLTCHYISYPVLNFPIPYSAPSRSWCWRRWWCARCGTSPRRTGSTPPSCRHVGAGMRASINCTWYIIKLLWSVGARLRCVLPSWSCGTTKPRILVLSGIACAGPDPLWRRRPLC